MTARRQENKGNWLQALLLIAVWLASPAILNAASTERVVSDRLTGLAIGGYDPVAYFTDGRPLLGSSEFEAKQGGAIWRFRNEANKAYFLANPEIYGPQFGGYDPTRLAQGKVVAGKPSIWIVIGQRLFLFNKDETRAAFEANSAAIAAQASDKWPALSEILADY